MDLFINPINGNVGIGTTNPQSSLHVNGTVFGLMSVINVSTYLNSTRATFASAVTHTYYSFTITKKLTNSVLLVTATIPALSGSNAGVSAAVYRVRIGAISRYTGIAGANNTNATGNLQIITINQYWTDINAGSVTIYFEDNAANNTSLQCTSVIHPNSTDDVRFNQTGSEWIITEVMT